METLAPKITRPSFSQEKARDHLAEVSVTNERHRSVVSCIATPKYDQSLILRTGDCDLAEGTLWA